MIIFLGHSDSHSSCYHRCIEPARWLNRDGVHADVLYVEDFRHHYQLADAKLQMADIVVFNGVHQGWIELARTLKGKKQIVWDFDDAEWLYASDPFFNLTHFILDTTALCREAMELADIITCTTKRMKDAIHNHFGKDAKLLPNAIDYDLPMWNIERTEGKKYRIGYLGGSYAPQMWIDMLPQMQAIDVEWHFCGLVDEALPNLINGNFYSHRRMPLPDYPRFFSQIDCVIVPVQEQGFRKYKSALKLIEAAGYNLNCIVSPYAPYDEWIDDTFVKLDIDNLESCVVQAMQKAPATKLWAEQNFDHRAINKIRRMHYGI